MWRHLPPAATPYNLSDLQTAVFKTVDAPEQFREALRHYLGCPHLYLAASGRTALYVILQILRRTSVEPQRQKVLLPAYTCPAIVKVILDVGLRPIFIDISPQTLEFDLDHLGQHLNDQTLAVIAVHPFGLPQPLAELQAMTQAAGAALIEDAAQAMGAKLHGQMVGTIGDFGLFSLGPGKALSTGGGGILCLNNPAYLPALEETWRELSQPSLLAEGWAVTRLALLALAFHPVGWGLAVRARLHRLGQSEAGRHYRLRRLSRPQAAVGLHKLVQLAQINQDRRERAAALTEQLHGLPGIQLFPPVEDAEASPIRLPLLVADADQRERLFKQLWAARIGVGKMYEQTLPQLFPQVAAEPTPGADTIAAHLLTLPTHHYLTPSDVQQIGRIFREETAELVSLVNPVEKP